MLRADRWFLAAALRAGAEQWGKDMQANRESERLSEQFKGQANKARRLAEDLEDAEHEVVILED